MRSILVFCKSLIVALLLSSSVRAANVNDALNALRDTLSEVMPRATFRFHSLPNGVVLRGTVAGRQDVELVQQIAFSYFPTVINEIETAVARDGDSSMDRKSGDIVKGAGAQRLNAKLQEIYPDLRLSTVEIPNAVVLFGEVEPSRDIKTILKISQQYFPKVINAIALSDYVSTKLRPAEPGDRVPSDPTAPHPTSRTEPSEIDQLRAEVRGLRDDVQRLIRLLEAGNTSTSHTADTKLHYKVESGYQRTTMSVNSSKILWLEQGEIPRVLVNNPELLNAVAIAPNKIQLSGLTPGVTQVNLWDSEENLYTIDVVVNVDARELEMLLEVEFPNASLRVRPLSKSLVLSGLVERPEIVSRVIRMAQDYAPKIINNIRVSGTLSGTLPSVVSIRGRAKTFTNGSLRHVDKLGAGVVIDKRGYVVTIHQIVDGVDRIEVTMYDGQKLDGRLVAHDPGSGLAIIKIDCDEPLPVIPDATSKDVMVGDPVTAVGNPYGYGHTTTLGEVSALRTRRISGKEYRGIIQADISANPGSSGGPLLNRDGELIGIMVGVRERDQGVVFAVPSDEVMAVVSQLIGTMRN